MKLTTARRILALLLIVCMGLTALISCSKTPGTTDETSTEAGTTTATVTEQPEEILNFVTAGATSFTLARPMSSEPDYVFNYFGEVKTLIKKHTGLTLGVSYEDNEGGEILIGSTGRKELEELGDLYKTKDYFVGVYKNKLIIYGATEITLKNAVKKFEEFLSAKATENKAEIKFSSLENYEYRSTNYMVETMKIADTSLRRYCIVYNKDGRYSEELLALKLKNKLEKSVGFPIEIYTDDKVDKDAHKILIGKTKYSSDVNVNQYEYVLEVKSGDLRLYADSIEGYSSLFSYVSLQVLLDTHVSLEEGLTVTKSVDTGKISTKINKSGDIRVILNNILGNCDNTIYPVIYRTRSVTELLASYNPDVLGLQECSPTSRSCNIVGLLKGYGYEEVYVKVTNSKASNYTPLFYNPKTVKVIAADYVYYNGSLNDGGSKSITWAVFESLSDGKQFAVCSTHFFYQAADKGGDAGRLENAKTLVATAKMIAEKYNVPVIAGGDLNTRTTTSVFKELTSNGFENIQGTARVTDNSGTHHSYPEFSAELGYYSKFYTPSSNVYTQSAIDHALVYNRSHLTFNLFDIVTEDFSLMSSDHCPLVIDFTFPK